MSEFTNWDSAEVKKAEQIIERMGLCGCGTDAHWEIVLELLERGENHDARGSFYHYLPQPEGRQSDIEDRCDSWVEFGAKVLDSWGLVEHGTGIGWAWLTDDGKLLLEFLRQFSTDDNTWPEWQE